LGRKPRHAWCWLKKRSQGAVYLFLGLEAARLKKRSQGVCFAVNLFFFHGIIILHMSLSPLFARLRGGLIVSCQALEDEPLHGAPIMAAMARAALQGGAVGIRANTPADIAAIRAAVGLPIIGLYKENIPGSPIFITPTLRHAVAVAEAGADMIALDATLRPHPQGLDTAGLICQVKTATGKPVLADVASYADGIAAWQAGADAVSTTLSGYTPESPQQETPDFALLAHLAADLPIPVIAEGRIATPEQAVRALDLGAFAVVVGSAITRPQWITRQFVKRMGRRE
jgi:N-acylglucosamine-6-phosphate 2-epimerase